MRLLSLRPVLCVSLALATVGTVPVLSTAALAADAHTAALAGSLLDNVPDSIFEPETFTLDNGLQVVVITNDRAPVVTHMVWYKVGSADDPRGRSGLAHFLEHLMFKGTDKIEPGEFSQIISSLGGQENAFTSFEYTAFYQTVAKEHLPLMMELEADRMTGLTLSPDIVTSERSVIAEERRQVIESRPYRRLGEAMDALLYAGSPYAVPIIGWSEDIDNLGQSDVENFYRRWYAPNNAVLIVSGDITLDELRPLAEKYYGPVKPSEDIPERIRPMPHPIKATGEITLRDPQVDRPSYVRSFLAPENTLRTEPEAYALSVLTNIMSSGSTSRLYEALVVKERIANSVGMAQGSGRISASEISLYGDPVEGKSVDDLSTALDAEIKRLLDGGVTDDEVAAAKERLLAQAIYARDSVSGPANIFGRSLMEDYTLEDVEAWPQRIAAVTTEMVNAVARDVFDEEEVVTGILMPPKAENAQEAELSQ